MPPPFPLIPTPSDGDPFCTQEFCDEGFYRSRFFRVDSTTSLSSTSGLHNLNGNESVIDVDGFIYAAHSWTDFTGGIPCLGPVITKISQSTLSPAITWSRQYKSADGDTLGPGGVDQGCVRLVLDASNNLWAAYTTYVPDNAEITSKIKYHFLHISKTTGNILFHKSFILNILPTESPSVHVWPQPFVVAVDPFGNWYIASSHEPVQSPWGAQQSYFVPVPPSQPYTQHSGNVKTPWIVKLNSNFTIQWGVRWAGRQITTQFLVTYTIPGNTMLKDIKYKNNHIYAVVTAESRFGFVPTLVRINATTGVLDTSWPAGPPLVPSDIPGLNNLPPYAADYSDVIAEASQGACIAIDSQLNVYVAGFDSTTDTRGLIVTKFLSNGIRQWSKHYSIATLSSMSPVIHITASDRIFIGQAESVSVAVFRGTSVLCEIAPTGQLLTVRRYENSFGNPSRSYTDNIRYLQTYAYSPGTLFCRFSLADHVDTTQDISVFNVGDRTMVQLALSSITQSDYFVRIGDGDGSLRSFHLDYWSTLRSDFYTYSNSFTVTTPDRATRLYDIGQDGDP